MKVPKRRITEPHANRRAVSHPTGAPAAAARDGRMTRRSAAWALALLILAGCAPRAYIAGQVGQMVADGMTAFEAEDDLDLVEKALPANIKLLEALLASSPDDRRLLTLLSRLHASYAFAFLETDLERGLLASDGCTPSQPEAGAGGPPPTRESVARYYRKGLQYGLRALQADHDAWRHEIDHPEALGKRLAALRPEDAPALFWYAFNLGAFIRLNADSIRVASQAHIVPSAMQRVIDLDPSYYYGLAHLVLLAYHARSPALGGDASAARRHYDTFRAAAGEDFLLAQVFHARYLLHQQQDRSGFESELAAVLARPENPAACRLLNQVARVRARIYLDAADCLFP